MTNVEMFLFSLKGDPQLVTASILQTAGPAFLDRNISMFAMHIELSGAYAASPGDPQRPRFHSDCISADLFFNS